MGRASQTTGDAGLALSVPLTRATLQRASTLPAYKPKPLWHFGGHREAWGWMETSHAETDNTRASAAADAPRLTTTSSRDACRPSVSLSADSAVMSRESGTSSGTADGATSSRGAEPVLRSGLPAQWQEHRIRQLYRQASGSAFDLGWTSAAELRAFGELEMPQPKDRQCEREEAIASRAAPEPYARIRRAVSLTDLAPVGYV